MLIFKIIGKADDFSELGDRDWLGDFAFAVDLLTQMNELNAKPQGKNFFAHKTYANIKSFKSKLTLFPDYTFNNSFVHFPTLVMPKEALQHTT